MPKKGRSVHKSSISLPRQLVEIMRKRAKDEKMQLSPFIARRLHQNMATDRDYIAAMLEWAEGERDYWIQKARAFQDKKALR